MFSSLFGIKRASSSPKEKPRRVAERSSVSAERSLGSAERAPLRPPQTNGVPAQGSKSAAPTAKPIERSIPTLRTPIQNVAPPSEPPLSFAEVSFTDGGASDFVPHEEDAPISNFTQIGRFNRILTVGADAVYKPPESVADKFLALDRGALKAELVRVSGLDPDVHADVRLHMRQAKGALRTQRFTVVTKEVVVTPAVFRDILKSVEGPTSRKAKSPALELFNRWIEIGVRDDATDIHIELAGRHATVRARIDGSLEPLADGQVTPGTYTAHEAINAVAAAYNDTRKGTNNSNYEAEKFVDCMISFDVRGASGQLRYQNLKGRLGPKVVVRILRSQTENRVTLQNAGYAPSHLKIWRQAARAGKGVIIISGVTGSGKSTSLVGFIENMPGLDQRAVYTIEDPIEYEVDGAHQIEVLRDLTSEEETRRRYGAVMKALMRADLDGASIGEIRDELTASFLLTIAETGHLAMGTLHAHLVSNIVPRLTNSTVGLTRDALTNPNIINTLVYQALVPKLCQKCCEPPHVAVVNDPEIREYLDVLRTRFKVPSEALRFKHVGGCPACGGRGTKGKTIVAEMWQPDRKWLELVRANNDYGALMHFRSFSDRDFTSEDMTGKTVFEHTLYKALQGLVDVRNCEEFETFERFEILGERA